MSPNQTSTSWVEGLQASLIRFGHWCLIAAMVILTFLAFGPVQDLEFVKRNIDPVALNQWLLGVLFVVLFAYLQQLRKDTGAIARNLSGKESLVSGVRNALNQVEESLETGRLVTRGTLTVLGLTMQVAWPSIEQWMRDGWLNDRAVVIYMLSAEQLGAAAWVPANWCDEARLRATEIQRMSELDTYDVAVRLTLHDCFPAVHGFLVDDAELWISFVHWERDRKIAFPGEFYEHFPASDRSTRAEGYRTLFRNWQGHIDGAPDVNVDQNRRS